MYWTSGKNSDQVSLFLSSIKEDNIFCNVPLDCSTFPCTHGQRGLPCTILHVPDQLLTKFLKN
jgi:hypothetical protein